MKRRTFLTTAAQAGLGVSATLGLAAFAGPIRGAFADQSPNPAGAPYDLVAVKNGEPDKLFDAAMEALGGMGRFVRPNQTVVVKPNIAWDVEPERAANTNPVLVRRIVEQCRAAGAKTVYVFDNTCDNWRRSYKTSGIEQAVRDAGGTLVSGESERYYQPVKVGGQRLAEAKEHELILESDVFINVPVLKDHGGATLTVAMKNLMGIIWDRRYWHRNDLHQCIADFAAYRRPDLNVVDAYRVLAHNGPRGVSVRDVTEMRSLLVSRDMVTADAAAARLLGLDPDQVGYIRLAAAQGVGRLDLENLAIKRILL
jgi:uncharacterized protein (DUF362 family)